MDIATVLSFWALALLLVVTPGPDWAFVLGHGLRGRRLAAPLVGIALGYLGLTTVVAAGLGAVVASRPMVMTLVTLAGAAVLAWIGVSMLRSALAAPVDEQEPTVAVESAPAPPADGGGVATLERTRTRAEPGVTQVMAQGATVSGLNPKGLMLFIALLPQFVDTAAPWPVGAQMFALGCVFIVSATSVYALLGVVARTALSGSARAARILTGVAGAAMILVAVVMTAEHFLT